MSKVLLVTGATGQQGRALIDTLTSTGQTQEFTILAVTRKAASPAAKGLEEKGVKIVQGNWDDASGIFREASKVVSEPIWGVFWIGISGPREEKHGKAMVDAALENNVKMFVYSSVDRGGEAKSFDNPTPIPHFISKHNVEHHLVEKSRGKMDWNILRPTAFMENNAAGFAGKMFATVWDMSLKGKPLQFVSVRDIGYFASQAFLHPHEYSGKGISLAGDELTFQDANKTFKEKRGIYMGKVPRPLGSFMLWAMSDFGKMFRWFYTDGFGADIAALKKTHPGLLSWSDWLDKRSPLSQEAKK